MGADDRRRSIIKYLCRCRYATIAHLAEAFSVSERTIRRDIEALSISEPVYTQPGRYGGGVYVMDGYYMDYIYFSEEETRILQKLLLYAQDHKGEVLEDHEIGILARMISNHANPVKGAIK